MTEAIPPAGDRAVDLLERVTGIYEQAFAEDDRGRRWLQAHGFADDSLWLGLRPGLADGRLRGLLPKSGRVIRELTELGVLDADGKEVFAEHVVFPGLDDTGAVRSLFAHALADDGFAWLAKCPWLWNQAAGVGCTELFVTPTVLDGLSLLAAGCANTAAVPLPTPEISPVLANLAVTAVVSESAGLFPNWIETLRDAVDLTAQVTLPDDTTVNAVLLEQGPEALAALIQAATPTDEPARPQPGAEPYLRCGLREYRVRGLERNARRLRATVRAEFAGKLHVDTLDLYCARSRRNLCRDLARVFEQPAAGITGDIDKLLLACEQWQPPAARTAGPRMSEPDREAARAFGCRENLVEQILNDYETCGLVGEDANKLFCYLAASSRKLPDPLSVLIISSSGAGKSALQDATLAFCPPEDVVKLTTMTHRALFYRDESSLRHKILALEEGAGVDEASYAIRNLISAGELAIESTVRDANTGKLTTTTNRVEGPTAVFYTVAQPDVDPETRSRFFILSVDESREQTERILALQRERQTLVGVERSLQVDEIRQRHRNFQRLLQPLAVVNSFAPELGYGDVRLQARRDQPKYLALIRAVAFLRQLGKEVKTSEHNGETLQYVEVDETDIAIANKIAAELLATSLDELSAPARNLLALLQTMTQERAAQLTSDSGNPDRPVSASAVTFTRREVREYTGWSNYRLRLHMKELVEFEFVTIESGRMGACYVYSLLWNTEVDGRTAFVTTANLAKPCGDLSAGLWPPCDVKSRDKSR